MLFENFVFGRRYIFRLRPGAVFLSVVVLILIVLDVFLDIFLKVRTIRLFTVCFLPCNFSAWLSVLTDMSARKSQTILSESALSLQSRHRLPDVVQGAR
jgi:hypothetical protein